MGNCRPLVAPRDSHACRHRTANEVKTPVSLLYPDGSHCISNRFSSIQRSFYSREPYLDTSKCIATLPSTTMTAKPASFLTLPTELRNAIYLLVFDDLILPVPSIEPAPDAPASALKFDIGASYLPSHQTTNTHSARRLSVLGTCRQIHDEAHLLALSMTPFHITGDCSYPDLFDLRSRPLSPAKIGAIRHLTLTARISHLRALNEAWAGLPFGHPSLKLGTLTIVPRKPDCSSSAYAEIADLSQSHTLAYIFAETFKGLRNVKTVEVCNKGCFNDLVWRIVYSSLVFRVYKWGGERCGLRFECSEKREDGSERDGWFRVHIGETEAGLEAGDEVVRLAGGRRPAEMGPDPSVGP